jgi:aspartate carbamoyltransferase catalytic subunit
MARMIGLKRQKTFDIVPENLISIRGLSVQFVQMILEISDEMKTLVATQGGDDRLKHKILATVFYEPSTRTSCSFQAAMLRLGGSVITVNEEQSSVKKGESLEDTIQTMSCYCDAIVLRHPQKGSAGVAATVATKPVINAGLSLSHMRMTSLVVTITHLIK